MRQHGLARDRRSSLTVFTIPFSAGFPRLEAVLSDYTKTVRIVGHR